MNHDSLVVLSSLVVSSLGQSGNVVEVACCDGLTTEHMLLGSEDQFMVDDTSW